MDIGTVIKERRALCRARKVDENDFFGMLEMK